MSRVVYILIISMFITSPIFSQRISKIEPVVSVEKGLSQNTILKLEQDSLGFLWIGTEAGLSRWNGNEIINYPNMSNVSLPGGFIKALHVDNSNVLWVVPGDGKLYSKHKNSNAFSEAIIDIGGFNSDVIFITSSPNRNGLLFITEDNKVYSWDFTISGVRQVANFRHKNILSFKWYKHDLLLGSDRGWLYIDSDLEVQSNIDINWLDNSTNPIFDIEVIGDDIYAARDKWGITVHNPNIAEYENISVESKFLVKDYHQQLLSTNSGDKITIFYDMEEFKYTEIDKPVNMDVSSFYSLDTGQTVIGTTASGLWMIDPFRPYFRGWSHDLSESNDIVSVIEDQDNNLWMALYGGGVIHFNPSNNSIKQYKIDRGNSDSDDITFLTIDNNNRIWAASQDRGFFLYDVEEDKFKSPLYNGLKNITFSRLKINHIYQKSSDTLLISSIKGLYEFNIPKGEAELVVEGDIWASHIDKDGNLWFCSDNGLYKYLNGSFSNIHFNSVGFWSITEEKNGDIITGGPIGLKILSSDGVVLEYENLNNITAHKPVYSITIDTLGYYWITTNSGLIRWNRTSDKVDLYTSNDGLLSNEFNRYSVIIKESGNILWGGHKGLIEINPNTITSNPFKTKLIIDKLEKISESEKVLESEFSSRMNLDRVVIEPDENIFRVGYQAIDFHDYNNIDIKYQLLGLSDTWVDVSNENNILFVNLSPKDYQLNIVATNISNNSSSQKRVNIAVKPFFVETVFFKFLVFLGISIFVMVVIIYVDKLRKEIVLRRAAEQKYTRLNNDLESVLETRTEELKLSNERMIQQEKMSSLGQLVAGVAHEINTPLGIAVLSNSYIHDNVKSITAQFKNRTLTEKNLGESLDDIEQASKQLTYNLDRAAKLITNFKQVAVDKNTDSVINFNISSSIISLLDSMRIKFKHNDVNINADVPEKLFINSFPSEISQIITNLIMNSMNHGFGESFTKDEKIISISIEAVGESCVIRCHDNGTGISDKHIHKVFDPFFTTNRSFGGTGLGLNIVYNIITEKLNGRIDVTSKVGLYTEFVITLPIE